MVIASAFRDIHRPLLIDILQKEERINNYYIALVDRLDAAIKQKMPNKAKTKSLFHQVTAPIYKLMKAMAK